MLSGVATGLLAAAALAPIQPVSASPRPATAPTRADPARIGAPTPVAELTKDLDAVVAYSPPDTCLSVMIDGEPVYQHDATLPLVPASTEKLLTATVALERLRGDLRFETRVVATAAPAAGVVTGDLTLVGGGDPTLMTDAYRFARRIGADQPAASLDALADRIKAAGVQRITGRVVGDETRYDTVRSVPSWPERYVTQNQSGPLSALTVDDGYVLRFPAPGDDGPVVRERSIDPAGDAARLLTDRLLMRGIKVDGAGGAGAGVAPAGAVDVAALASAPLEEIVGYMLLSSDNQIAELLTKEIGRAAGGGGTTAAGAVAIEQRAAELKIRTAGSDVVDGSGLDPGNRVTCDELMSVLGVAGGPGGAVGRSLPVAGRSGTLADRFRGTTAEGRLRAKTGSLSSVTALAGFVDLPEGGTATFAYVANGRPVGKNALAAQDLLGNVLAGYLPPCPDTASAPLVAPVAPYAGQVATLAMFPLQSVLLPGAVLPLHVFEDRYRALVDRCVALDEDFGVVLIARGSEVGGQDQRTDVGTRARIVEAQQATDGRWAVIAVGLTRLRVDAWLPDAPHPLADTSDWPDPPAPSGLDGALEASTARLRRVLGLRGELGEPGPPSTVDLEVDLTVDDASLASYRLVGLSPLGDLDRQRLLASPDIGDRLARLDGLLDEEENVCRQRLSGG